MGLKDIKLRDIVLALSLTTIAGCNMFDSDFEVFPRKQKIQEEIHPYEYPRTTYKWC